MTSDDLKAECVVCKKQIKIDLGGVSQLNHHASTAKHIKLHSSYKNQVTFVRNSDISVSLSKAKNIVLSEEDSAIKAEIICCLNGVNYNHSFASANLNGDLYRSMFPDSNIAKLYKESETKMKYVI